MATEQFNSEDVRTLPVAADYSAKQFFFMRLDTNGRILLVDGATNHSIGILLNDPSAIDQAGEIGGTTGNIYKVVADGSGTTIVVGDKIGPDATGKAVKKTSGEYHGIALDTTAADGEVIGIWWSGTTEV